jgi:hypothetical protein
VRAFGVVLAVAAALVVPGQQHAAAQEAFAYADLIQRLIDLRQPAALPAPGETCKQWSSWDRSSQYDTNTGKYVKWSANNDGPNFIRSEGDEVVMAEMEGPGCVWRIWSARASDGHVRIYLDGAETPAVDLPFKDYFSGHTAPFHYPMLSYDLAKHGSSGLNLYFPIPYQESCKIVANKGWGRYYQIGYTTFSPGAKVPTFSTELVAEQASALARCDAYLRKRMDSNARALPEDARLKKRTFTIAAGKTTEAAKLTGAQAITEIMVETDFADRADEMATLREVCLQITFDGQEKPAVWCPLGDFFGTAPGRNLHKSLPTCITKDGFRANWYMPFEEKAVVELVNDGHTDREIVVAIRHVPLDRPFAGLGPFHCKWHRDTTRLPDDRWPDRTMLETQGRGRYLGAMLHVWNPHGAWWGEGDEKFFVDGEKNPSTFGTGTEDYFGYAWGHPGEFQRPFHCQTLSMNNRGHQSLLRWHIADNVPFQTSFEGCIEKYFGNEDRGTLYAATVCWYLSPDGIDPYHPIPVEHRHDYYATPPLMAAGLRVLGTPPGHIYDQSTAPFGGSWKDDDHLIWAHVKPGDKLGIAVPVKENGDYAVSVVLTKCSDYGIFQLTLDGKKTGEPVDLFDRKIQPTKPIPLGTHRLSAGEHALGVEVVGTNPAAKPNYIFGLDRILLEPVR